jgi:S1-C subfamily serine protease
VPAWARVLTRDSRRDLPLVRLDQDPDGARAIPLAARSARHGQQLHSIGNPGVGGLWSYARGTVRGVEPRVFQVGEEDELFEVKAQILESDIPFHPGDSGGPVVNDRGELVGIVQSYCARCRNWSYSIDVREVKALLAELVKTPVSPFTIHRPEQTGK